MSNRKGQPLFSQSTIVNANGTPTDSFIRWAQDRQIDIFDSTTAEQVDALINEWAAGRTIIAGDGLTGGGTLDADVTLAVGAGTGIDVDADAVNLADTAVTPGSYTSADITVDQQGRITAASSGSGGGGEAWVQIVNSSFTTTPSYNMTGLNLDNYKRLLVICQGLTRTSAVQSYLQGSTNNGSSWFDSTGDHTTFPQGAAASGTTAGLGEIGTASTAARQLWVIIENTDNGLVKWSWNQSTGNTVMMTSNTTPLNALRIAGASNGSINQTCTAVRLYGILR